MKAYRLEGGEEGGRARAGAKLSLVGREVPQPGRGDVLVRVEAVGVCHRELVELRGGHPAPFALPLIAGHEVRSLPPQHNAQCTT
jgi:D-arabinose 1-dehydrogenase-like Zn-dependent alcohol dehydrogenase